MTNNDSVWSIEELVALTDEIQKTEVSYRGKVFSFEYAELTEAEEPKMVPLDDKASEEDQANWYQKVGSERILAMIQAGMKPSTQNMMTAPKNCPHGLIAAKPSYGEDGCPQSTKPAITSPMKPA